MLLSLGALHGCMRVQPYEREYLADPLMQVEEFAEDTVYEQHITQARSQSSNGNAAGKGAGCGCEQ